MEFAHQAQLTLLLDPAQLQSQCTQAVHGELSLREALSRLLAGTGITVQFNPKQRKILVVPHERTTGPSRESAPSIPTVSIESDPASPSTEVDVHAVGSTLVVTGTHIANTLPVGATLILISRENILHSGAANLGELIQRLPQVFRGGPSQMTHGTTVEAQSNSGLGAGIDLRGLGARSTLVLIDGIRLAPSGNAAAFVDVSNIPVAALDHIEILLDGASAIYGADAVGGVVNFVTLPRNTAPETFIQAGGVTHGSLHEVRLGQATSHTWATGDAVFAAELDRQSPLNSTDRPYLSSDQRPYGGPVWGPLASNPGTLWVDGIPYAIPRGSTGVLSPKQLVPYTFNLTDSTQNAQVIPGQSVDSLFAKVHQQFGNRTEVKVEFLSTHRRATQTNGGVQEALTVPSSNPFYVNPHGGTEPVVVSYDFVDDLGPRTTQADVWVTLAALGLKQKIGAGSVLNISLSHASERENQHIHGEVNDPALSAALADRNPASALNIFGDGSHSNPATLARIARTPWYHSLSTYDTLAFSLESRLAWALGSSIRTAIGAEIREQRFDTVYFDDVSSATSRRFRRRMEAVFGELDLPIGESARFARRLLQHLDLTFAARFERYSEALHATTPGVGLRWQPLPQWWLRARYSQSFRVPDAGDLDTTQNATFLANLPDRSAPSGMSTVVLAVGGNAELRQERAISRTLSLGFLSEAGDRWRSRIELSYFDDELLGRIESPVVSSESLATVLNDPDWQNFVLHEPSSSLRNQICSSWLVSSGARTQCLLSNTIIDLRLQNIQSLRTRGIDLDATLAWNPDWATLQWSFRGTWLLSYDTVDPPQSPRLSLLNRIGEPVDLTFQSTLRASRHRLSGAATINFVDHYCDTLVIPNASIASWIALDLQLAYRFGDEGSLGSATEWELGLTALNAFDRAPPAAPNPTALIAYDPANATAWGRVVTLYARKRW